jgi:hypothetical protein
MESQLQSLEIDLPQEAMLLANGQGIRQFQGCGNKGNFPSR